MVLIPYNPITLEIDRLFLLENMNNKFCQTRTILEPGEINILK